MTSSIVLDTPIMTIEKFADKTGVTPASVRSMVNLQQIPTKKMGKRRYINIAALTTNCLQDVEQNSTTNNDE
jgi:hypothetical protein